MRGLIPCLLVGALLGCESQGKSKSRRAAAVAVAALERGSITLRRTYSGTLEAPARFVVAPKIGGRLEALTVDLGDPVKRGQLVARIDDDELNNLAAQARAELEVAKANLIQAESALAIATRELARVEKLRKRGVISESQLDVARVDLSAREADLAVAKAEVSRRQAAHNAARTRLGYAQVTAEWNGEDEERLVAERFVSAGAMISAAAPILSIVRIDTITCVISVAETDYRHLSRGQVAILVTDAYPNETFEARVERIAPVFAEGSRQARAELRVDNKDHRLKPGMFVRATVVLRSVEDAVVAAASAITTRNEQTGVFLVDDSGQRVSWQPVQIGVRDGERVELIGADLSGRVVTLGQQLINDGSRIEIPEVPSPNEKPSPESRD